MSGELIQAILAFRGSMLSDEKSRNPRRGESEGRGRYSDPEGHSEAAERGWRNR
jgi:hypothetical protein